MADPYTWTAIITAAVGTGTTIYTQRQQSKDAEAAAKFNSREAKNAAKRKGDDDRQNALRRQESHRKYLAGLKARMFEKSNRGIEGADLDFLDESVGNLELEILDAGVRSQRTQAAYTNQAFAYEAQASNINSSRGINTAATALSGFNSVYSAGQRGGAWGQPRRLNGINAIN